MVHIISISGNIARIIIRSANSEIAAAEVLQINRARAFGSDAQQDRQKLGVAKRRSAFLEKFLPRPVIFRPAFNAS